MAAQAVGGRAYRVGVAIAVITSLLTAWTTIVRDDGNGIGSFMVILAVAVGWFAAGFRAAGMARAMAGVAAGGARRAHRDGAGDGERARRAAQGAVVQRGFRAAVAGIGRVLPRSEGRAGYSMISARPSA